MEGENQVYSRGKLLRSVRTTLCVPVEETRAGLCSASTLGNYERGEEEPGKWVSDMLLERLGQIPDQFSCMYHKKEMEECLYRDMQMYFLGNRCEEIFWMLWQESWRALGQETAAASDGSASDGSSKEGERKNDPERNCQEQFLRGARVLACYEDCYEKESEPPEGLALQGLEEMVEETERALCLTLPKEALRDIGKFRLGRIETALKALQADLFCQKDETRENGLLLYQELLDKIKTQFSEPKAQYYPYQYLAALYLRRLALAGRYQETSFCQECWNMIRKGKYLYGLETLLCYEKEGGLDTTQKEAREGVLELLESLEFGWWEEEDTKEEEKREEGTEGKTDKESRKEKKDRGTEEAGEKKGETEETGKTAEGGRTRTDWKRRQLDDFIELMRPAFRGLPLGESVAAIRRQKKLSQRKLGEATDITVKTIRRLEHGEVESSFYVYQKVLRALGRDGYRYSTDILSNELAVHEQYQRIHRMISHWEYKEAQKEVEDFVEELYRKEPINRQCIEMLQTILDGQFRKITKEEELKRLRAALALTVPEDADLETWPLMYQEIALLNNIANAREALGEFQEAEKLLNQVVKNCERNPVGVDKNAPQYLLTLFNLERYLGKQKRYEEGLAVSKKGLRLSYRVKDGAGVVEFLYKLVWNREQIYEQKARKQEQGGNGEAARALREQKKKVCLPVCRQTLALAELLDYKFYIEHIQKHCQKEYEADISFPVD